MQQPSHRDEVAPMHTEPSPDPLDLEVAARIIDLVDSLPHMVGVTDGAGRVLWMNRSGCEFLGAGPDDDLTTADVFGPAAELRYIGEIEPAILEGEQWSGHLPVRRADGTMATVDAVVTGGTDQHGRVRWMATLAVDVTDQLRREAELAHRASHDPLTGLPNRALLEDRLHIATAVASRTGATVAVIVLDLDGFKEVNDRHGHAAGDLVLQQVTARLSATVRPADTVARLGGDEFVIVVHPPESPRAAAVVAQRLCDRIGDPGYAIDGGEALVTASVGLAVANPGDRIDARELLAAADQASYRAKRAGGNCVRVSSPSPARTRQVASLVADAATRPRPSPSR